jgi:predicted Rossmann-fold nucleotide-binding protein
MEDELMNKLTLNKLTLISAVLILSLVQSVAFAKTNTDDCLSTADNATYTGPYKGVENNLTTDDFTRDLSCANAFISKKYPQKFVTIFGSSRIAESNNSGDKVVDAANDKLYQQIYNLSYNWTKMHAEKFPIMTGAGPGIMEAGARGAFKAGGPSIGYTTYYGPSRNGEYGDASKAFWKYPSAKGKAKTIITDGLIFTSVAIREAVMVMHSAAMVFAPGGTGTEWEIYQTIEQIKSNQLTPVPIYIVGEKKIHWQSFYNRLDDMVKRGTIKRHEVEALFVHVDNPEDVVKLLARDLKLN